MRTLLPDSEAEMRHFVLLYRVFGGAAALRNVVQDMERLTIRHIYILYLLFLLLQPHFPALQITGHHVKMGVLVQFYKFIRMAGKSFIQFLLT